MDRFIALPCEPLPENPILRVGVCMFGSAGFCWFSVGGGREKPDSFEAIRIN